MGQTQKTGKRGEELAADFLTAKGYKVLEVNWRFYQYEIDIVAESGDELIIVEVKTRKSLYAGTPEVAVNKQKQRTLIRAANNYVNFNNIDLDVRFDIISVIISGEEHMVYHIEDAFYPLL